MYSPSNQSTSNSSIAERLFELEDAWAQDRVGTEAIEELRQLTQKAMNGADKHLAYCLIERLEDVPPRNDGEVQRLLQKRDNIRWQKKIRYIPANTQMISSNASLEEAQQLLAEHAKANAPTQ